MWEMYNLLVIYEDFRRFFEDFRRFELCQKSFHSFELCQKNFHSFELRQKNFQNTENLSDISPKSLIFVSIWPRRPALTSDLEPTTLIAYDTTFVSTLLCLFLASFQTLLEKLPNLRDWKFFFKSLTVASMQHQISALISD